MTQTTYASSLELLNKKIKRIDSKNIKLKIALENLVKKVEELKDKEPEQELILVLQSTIELLANKDVKRYAQIARQVQTPSSKSLKDLGKLMMFIGGAILLGGGFCAAMGAFLPAALFATAGVGLVGVGAISFFAGRKHEGISRPMLEVNKAISQRENQSIFDIEQETLSDSNGMTI